MNTLGYIILKYFRKKYLIVDNVDIMKVCNTSIIQ